jgi:hypothetical protein
MYQTLIDKFADVLLPIICGVAVWLGVHYFVLTPRIIKVEMPLAYDAMAIQLPALPASVHHCLRSHYAGAVMKVGRFEAALFTASLKHIARPFNKKSLEAIDLLDKPCGVTKALQAEKERLQLEAEQKTLATKNRRRAEIARLRRKAETEAQRRKMQMIGAVLNLFFGGK